MFYIQSYKYIIYIYSIHPVMLFSSYFCDFYYLLCILVGVCVVVRSRCSMHVRRHAAEVHRQHRLVVCLVIDSYTAILYSEIRTILYTTFTV